MTRSQSLDAPIADSIRRLRSEQGLSLEALAGKAEVSKSMISKIERGETSPTANTLGRLAEALDVSLSQLMGVQEKREVIVMRKSEQPLFKSDDGSFQRRCLSPIFPARGVDFVLNKLAAKSRSELAVGHKQGVDEHLYVAGGRLLVHLGDAAYDLEAGDSLYYHADVAHEFENPGDEETTFFIVIDSSGLRK
ncbi:helix-turn-helix domain-containing protein [Pelagibius sp. Alg239-R121]|uniref:helix-turn-helix domain-containing protein n=1 Tax=Pelagibius sp. Alg239-R121 TaxID=2993448 RepID=UPI0024A6B825|nr:XRE family transcriptional regulator [Pelagibius sp. Alg239-R121]